MNELELAEAWEHYTGLACEVALDRLVRHYTPLARFLARRAILRAPEYQEADDLLSDAQHGLLDAIKRFEPARGFKFETYASRRIAGAIVDGQRRNDPLTRAARKSVNQLRDATHAFWTSHNRQPTVEDLAEALDLPADEVRHLLVARQTVTSELPADLDVRGSDNTGDVVLQSQAEQVTVAVATRLARLDERARSFAFMYYVERRTLREIGSVLGCSDSRCAQIRKEVVAALTAA